MSIRMSARRSLIKAASAEMSLARGIVSVLPSSQVTNQGWRRASGSERSFATSGKTALQIGHNGLDVCDLGLGQAWAAQLALPSGKSTLHMPALDYSFLLCPHLGSDNGAERLFNCSVAHARS